MVFLGVLRIFCLVGAFIFGFWSPRIFGAIEEKIYTFSTCRSEVIFFGASHFLSGWCLLIFVEEKIYTFSTCRSEVIFFGASHFLSGWCLLIFGGIGKLTASQHVV